MVQHTWKRQILCWAEQIVSSMGTTWRSREQGLRRAPVRPLVDPTIARHSTSPVRWYPHATRAAFRVLHHSPARSSPCPPFTSFRTCSPRRPRSPSAPLLQLATNTKIHGAATAHHGHAPRARELNLRGSPPQTLALASSNGPSRRRGPLRLCWPCCSRSERQFADRTRERGWENRKNKGEKM